jgi:large subunit ribosomal protein L53
MEFLAQCNSRKAEESNPGCEVEVKRGIVELPPQITVTFVNGVEEVFDATSTPVHRITRMILEKGQFLETEQMFREAGEQWPVIIPDEELSQHAPGTKVRFLDFKLLYSCVLVIHFFDQVQPENELAVELHLTMFIVIIL